MRLSRTRLTKGLVGRNAVLAGLSGRDLSGVIDAGKLVELNLHELVHPANQKVGTVIFPLDSVLSVLTHMKDGTMVEAAMIGREGGSDCNVLLGGESAVNECRCQLPGTAVEISTEHVHKLLSTSQSFRLGVQRFLRAHIAVLGQLVACNRLHSIYQRTARWLLLSHDRSGRDRIPLTHEYLAMMLGSRRPGVSIALAKLKESGSITYGTGYVTVGDLRRLEDAACECYVVTRDQFAAVSKMLTQFAT